MTRRRSARRSPWRSLADGLVFLALFVLAALALGRTGWYAPEEGRYLAIDGDSLRKGEQEYRLHGIDAPELHQHCQDAQGRDYACGRAARDHLKGLVSGQTLACDIRETDRYGRLVADCRAGATDINRAMVQSGWAIAYRRHGTSYSRDEAEARSARRGIWQGRFETPERWRDQNRTSLVQGSTAAEPMPED